MYLLDNKTIIIICISLICLAAAASMIRYVLLRDMDGMHKAHIIVLAIALLTIPAVSFFEIIKKPPVRIPTVREHIDEISNQQHVTDSLMSARLVHLEELCDSLLLIANSKTENLATSKD